MSRLNRAVEAFNRTAVDIASGFVESALGMNQPAAKPERGGGGNQHIHIHVDCPKGHHQCRNCEECGEEQAELFEPEPYRPEPQLDPRTIDLFTQEETEPTTAMAVEEEAEEYCPNEREECSACGDCGREDFEDVIEFEEGVDYWVL